MSKKRNLAAYSFIAPHLVLFLLFFLIPAVVGIYVSFTKWDIYTDPQWVGFKNYYEILLNSESIFYEQFWNGLKNTFIFSVLTIPFCIIIPLLFAVLLNNKPKGYKFFQSVFYVPGLLSISAVMLAWNFMFNKTFGLVNNITNLDINWGSTFPWYWIALVIITVWWCIGGNMVIYQAAIASVSKDYYEAASIDGAGHVKQFFKITLPSIKNQILYTLVMTTIAQFNIYGQPLMFNNGGPNGANRVLLMYIRELGFGQGNSLAGMASAMAVLLGICILFICILQAILSKDDDAALEKKQRKMNKKLNKKFANATYSVNEGGR
ncbi:sugar ABC transporter permease [Clostridium sp. AL.422]|uniref:carbohydrate ABC transporter permease n=1 Tax=Clostridium TaxID=1485 RepID=UPI00293DFAE4|nr:MULTISPECIES: sugar ABC transporter permease [unclassified Clostridium]MDV4151860.1 sugar ABC transporter permease [Clostridium sp. AL.422]